MWEYHLSTSTVLLLSIRRHLIDKKFQDETQIGIDPAYLVAIAVRYLTNPCLYIQYCSNQIRSFSYLKCSWLKKPATQSSSMNHKKTGDDKSGNGSALLIICQTGSGRDLQAPEAESLNIRVPRLVCCGLCRGCRRNSGNGRHGNF